MKQKLLLKAATLVLLMAGRLNASANTYYVRAPGNGSDANNGSTWALGFATLNHAVTVATAAGGVNTIYMEGGNAIAPTANITLPASLTIQGSWYNVTTTPMYDPVAHITKIDFTNGSLLSNGSPVIKFVLEGLQISNGTGPTITGAGLGANATITFEDMVFKGVGKPFTVQDDGTSGTANTAVTVKNVIITNSTQNAAVAVNGGSINMDNLHVSNPTPQVNSGQYLSLDGGLGTTTGNVSAPINISNSSFCDNFGQGAAVTVAADGPNNFVGSSTVTITNSYFRGNYSSIMETSLVAYPGANVSLSGVTFYNNSVNGNTTAPGADIVSEQNGTGNGKFVSIQNSTFQLGPDASAYNFVATQGTSSAAPAGTYTFGSGNSFSNTINDPGQCITSLNQSIILPVTGLALTVQAINGTPQLNWQTLTESNTSYFNIQSSADGSNFTTIGKVAAAGNSNAALNYTFTDNAATGTVVYYRIQTVDKDGKTTVSNIVAVRLANAGTGYKVYPNPATNLVNIETGVAGNYLVELFTNDGRKVQAANVSSASGLVSFNINRSNITSGIYVVKTTDIKVGSSNYSTILVK